ncbi:hypothetical protein KVR01_009334 [Diaporthe batatas]|uniref:uncharacterized protein n=1 Tax=Diaporthe batatas TaxID=748121 RepID=UPI001D03A891|nr:uncharacterized protein KVR01_009334 [Diaporthe batatas]KAG8161070.1 hypothetical protein KVR01_009334 [Diaporthe batatas]
MPSPIVPPPLQPGQTIAFVSPSARVNTTFPAALERAKALFTSQGYHVRELFTKDTGIQSSIANRLAELRTALTDPTISAVVCTAGGTSFTELLPALLADADLHAAVRARPKVVVGWSDITGLHWLLHATAGLRTFYGPCALPALGEPAAQDEAEHDGSALAFCLRHLLRAVTDPAPLGGVARSPTYAPDPPAILADPASLARPRLAPSGGWAWLRPGRAQGRLFGGCLSVMARLGGVRGIAPDWRGRIVFFETALGEDDASGPALDRVRAGLADLIAQGVFDDAAGVVVGRPFGYDSPAARARYAGVITALLCEGRLAGREFPILFNVDIGHTTPMVTLPFDALAVLDSERDQFSILDSALQA